MPATSAMTEGHQFCLDKDRYFDPIPAQKEVALQLYEQIANLPLICPHGHVDPRVFADPDFDFGTPVDLFIIPDHYITRMLYSQGVPLQDLGISPAHEDAAQPDHRTVWQTFAEHFYLFRGTPTGMWLEHELYDLFDVRLKLNGETAGPIYDQIVDKLATPEFRPRRLYDRFNIEVLCTTDPATSDLRHHRAIRESGWHGRILPTFRPDAVVNLHAPGWQQEIDRLGEVSGIDVHDYRSYIHALEQRRSAFKEMGATATDHAVLAPHAELLSPARADAILQRALAGESTEEDARQFTAHMLMEMARMSMEDGLVMQIHPGSYRNHNRQVFDRFGPDMGADIPVRTEYTRNLQPLLNRYGNQPGFTLILFTLDESTYGRELAPLAGHYPAVKLGPPWWFFDSWNGMMRFRELIAETAGIYNTVGFNDDTRAFPSIPARHDLARRVDANWVANLVVRKVVDEQDGQDMVKALASDLAKTAYNLGD